MLPHVSLTAAREEDSAVSVLEEEFAQSYKKVNRSRRVETPCPRAQLGKMYPNSTDPSEPVWSRVRKLREIPEQRENAQSAESREDIYPQGVRPETIIFFCYLA